MSEDTTVELALKENARELLDVEYRRAGIVNFNTPYSEAALRAIEDALTSARENALEGLHATDEETWDKMLDAGFDAAEGLIKFETVQKVWDAMLVTAIRALRCS